MTESENAHHAERAEALEDLQHALIICDENLRQAAEARLKKAVPQLGMNERGAADPDQLPGELIERIEANRADPSRLIKRERNKPNT